MTQTTSQAVPTVPHDSSSNTAVTKKMTAEELAIAIEKNKWIYDRYYDEDMAKLLVQKVMPILKDIYFRPAMIGFEDMPERNNPKHPIIFISNHSGMAFPWDGMVFLTEILERFNYNPKKIMRGLAAPLLSQTVIMNPFMIPYAWKKTGGIDATYLNFETMMQHPDSHLLIYPEGVPGIGKGFDKKYQLQRFATSFVRMSLKYKTDVIPFSTVNGEYVNPYCYSIPWINNLSSKLGVPYIPIGFLLLLVPIFPWLWYYACPAKMTYVRGTRISPYQWIDKPYEEMTDADIAMIRDKIHASAQKDLDEAVAKYGNHPFQLKELFSKMWNNMNYFPFYLPFAWPFLFNEANRLYEKQKKEGKPVEDLDIYLGWGALLKMMIMNPITICYFIPILGWIPLIFLGFRKLPEWED